MRWSSAALRETRAEQRAYGLVSQCARAQDPGSALRCSQTEQVLFGSRFVGASSRDDQHGQPFQPPAEIEQESDAGANATMMLVTLAMFGVFFFVSL